MIPALVLIHRRPLAGVAIWVAVVPLVIATASPALRQVYWLLHRALPIGVLVLLVVSSALRITPRRLGRLDRSEVFVGGFVLIGFASIALLSGDPAAQTILFYDRWVPAICLYLIVRLVEPSRHDLRWLVPVAVALLVVEAPIAVATLTIPHALPQEWIVLTRATGTFGDPDVLGATMAFCGVLCLWAGTTTARPVLRAGSILLFVLAMLIVFLTFSRANWLAGVLVVAGCAWVFRDRLGRSSWPARWSWPRSSIDGGAGGPARVRRAAAGVPAGPGVGAGAPAGRRRGGADVPSPTAHGLGLRELRHLLARLPGRHRQPRDAREGPRLPQPVPHPPRRARPVRDRRRSWPPWRSGSFGTGGRASGSPLHARRFAAGLWLVVLAFVVVNNFSVMKSPYGLGLWWLCIGLIATTVARYLTPVPSRLGVAEPAREDADG